MALMAEELRNWMARGLAGCFEDTAQGDQLQRVIFDRKGLPRGPAAPSVGVVVLQRPTAAGGAGTVEGNLPGGDPAPTRIRTNSGITYLMTTPVAFGASDLGPFTASVQAELAGVDYEVDADQAWSFVDPVFDTSIVVTNPAPDGEMSGAANEETADEYRARSKNFWRTVRRGTIGAIEFGLKSTPGIASVSVAEILDATGLPALSVQAFILDTLGRANSTLGARGLLTLNEFRAAGIPVIIVPGVPEFVNIRFPLRFDPTLVTDTARAANDARSAMVAALNNQV